MSPKGVSPTYEPPEKLPSADGGAVDGQLPFRALGPMSYPGHESTELSAWDRLQEPNKLWRELANAWSPRELDEFKQGHKIAWIDGLPQKLQNDIDGLFKGASPGQPAVQMPAFERLAVRPPQDIVLPPWAIQLLGRLALKEFLIEVHGSLEAGIAHLRSIRQVKGRPEIWLPEQTCVAYERAVENFEREHPGFTIVTTPVAWTLRNAHTAKSPDVLQRDLGELQSALNGKADPQSGPFPLAQYFGGFAIKAWENPNLKLPGGRGYDYYLEKFGGKPGRARMSSINPSDIARAAQGTGSGTDDLSPALRALKEQFTEMAATSKRFQASMAAHLPKLKQARDQYLDSMPLSPQSVDNSVRQRATDIAAEVLRTEFADWITAINEEIAQLQASPGEHQAEIEERTWYRDQLTVPEFVFGKKTRSAKDEPEEAVADLMKNPRYGETHRNRGDIVRDGAYGSYRFGNIPLIQLLEQGSLRDDPMTARTGDGGERLGVFNADVVVALAREGIVPGALVGDTTRFFVRSNALEQALKLRSGTR